MGLLTNAMEFPWDFIPSTLGAARHAHWTVPVNSIVIPPITAVAKLKARGQKLLYSARDSIVDAFSVRRSRFVVNRH